MQQMNYLLSALILLALAQPAWATFFAKQVLSYSAGNIQDPVNEEGVMLDNSLAAIGAPDGITGETGLALFGGFPFPSVLSPFSPAFERDEIVQIGAGGHLELQLDRFVEIGSGPEIGVFSNVGLVDSDFPNGTTGAPASTFSPPGMAILEVSDDGTSWIAVNNAMPTKFDLPTMFYNNAGPFDGSPPATPLVADFGLPFQPVGGFSALDGLVYADLLSLLAGSAGGTWLDLDGTGLDRVGYLRFSVPADALGTSGETTFELDAVSIANDHAGSRVPEPSACVLAMAGLAAIMVLNLSGKNSIPISRTMPPSQPDDIIDATNHNARAWDSLARRKVALSQPAGDHEFNDPLKTVDPLGWLGESITGKQVLCLAAGGGRQSALYASAGARVTIVDISEEMLMRDRAVAAERGLEIRVIQASMERLSMLADGEFDIVIQPVSTCYVADVAPVFREVARTLRCGGLYVSQHKSPTSLQTELRPGGLGYELVEPYYRSGPLPAASPSRLREAGTREYLHRWEQLIGGMCRAGFVIEDLVEPLHAKANADRGSFGHRAKYVAPYVRIKARRTPTIKQTDIILQ